MSLPVEPKAVSRPDRAALIGFMIVGVAISLWAVITAVTKIVGITSDSRTAVLAQFDDTPANTAIGPDGAPVEVELSSAFLTLELPTPVMWCLILQQVITAVTIIIVVGTLLSLGRDVLRGRVFSKRNTIMVATAGIVGIVGAVAAGALENFAGGMILDEVAGPRFSPVILEIQPFPYIMAAFLAGLLATVFTVGERLQRETEGLV
ncbi:hypothetical protein FB566_5261 [Stackebrandtia endophytica]|uniref:DUF2975 family protein n=1 Tax=Stackebrandtia endophytica TaxID=1496996 RepID=A0A543B4A0_9ACTN|nr:hypothetical protein [Stackebrandtia endophytica]TQL79651.1 hypothetical protein FB566_5261 [Stackebrandtia endophytica]